VGDRRGAVEQYRRATRLQPENPDTWFQLGYYELLECDVFPACAALNHAYTLDPFGPTGVPGGPLDQARSYVEKRATCRR
jgi:predicted TPR repeat methyltransferase